MGCDIHGWVEIKRYPESNFWWRAMNVGVFATRNYGLFDTLFGVRGNSGGLFPDRGLPADCDESIQEEYNDGEADWHSATHVYGNELMEINPKTVAEENESENWKTMFIFINLLCIKYGAKNVRMIVWFDN